VRNGTDLGISADVLSTVQSSIGAGQDASQTLSRLMDWAEAREVRDGFDIHTSPHKHVDIRSTSIHCFWSLY
jgi:hypothetical protein